ncbi:MAG: site-2 protease family protein [Oscillospiraceae bacterium]|nr:site-2 protease family protein [Oscillospiraceae bacterium]
MNIFSYRPVFRLFDWVSNPTELNAIALLISCFSVAVMIFVVFPIHECAHALSAKLLGDDTAERQGRITLNPFAHIDLLGSLLLLIAPIGWAKPVPVNISRCRKVKPKTAMALTALAGPLSNIFLAYIFVIISKLVIVTTGSVTETIYYLYIAVFLIVELNVFIAVFNLLPVPPLDGSKVLFAYLKPRYVFKIMQYQPIITLVFLLLFLYENSPLRILVSRISIGIINMLDFLSGFISVG